MWLVNSPTGIQSFGVQQGYTGVGPRTEEDRYAFSHLASLAGLCGRQHSRAELETLALGR